MANADAPNQRLPQTPGQNPETNQTEKKVTPSTERVENVNKVDSSSDTRDMGDVVARDSAAKDGVKSTP